MIKRAVIVCALYLSIVLIVVMNPRPLPTIEENSRWEKISSHGNTISLWGGPWRCVYDTSTQLMWEVKSDIEDLHDHQCSFSWYQHGKGVAKRGDCFISGEASASSDIVEAANKNRLCGHQGWRLPTANELETLLQSRAKPGVPLVANALFPYTKNAPYWTSDIQRKDGDEVLHAIALDFSNGERQSLPVHSATFIRLVAPVLQIN